ncbi:transporter [Pullulanibacillus camelliae]|uniref:Transporter n=1 Tax=Pullulanibacillus camelliae TaxID=1707096 RepID=A0A8J2VUA3_9BACL|nr:MFS transporter [Pullulanibacillus camelliae]GGE40143.1 transporter [Pullulanibacillus camelliae]
MRSFTLASYATYFLAGLVVTTLGSVMPQLLNHYDLSYTKGGELVFVGSIGFLFGVPISTLLLSHWGEKLILAFGASLIAVAQFGFFFLPSYHWLFVFNFINNTGAAIFETIVATLIMEVFVGRRAVMMSYLEVSFGLGAFVMPLIASAFIAFSAWRFSFFISGSIALVMMGLWLKVTYSKTDIDDSKAMDAAAPSPIHMKKYVKWMVFALFVGMICLYTGIEGSLNNFLSSIFIHYLHAIPYVASLSIGAFWVTMVLGRMVTGIMIRRVTYDLFLTASICSTILCFIAFILLRQQWVGFLLVICLGFTMSGIYSITMVYANHSFPGLSRQITSTITAFAGIGNAAFPALVGMTMDAASIQAALWLIVGFSLLYLFGLIFISRLHRKKQEHPLDIKSGAS